MAESWYHLPNWWACTCSYGRTWLCRWAGWNSWISCHQRHTQCCCSDHPPIGAALSRPGMWRTDPIWLDLARPYRTSQSPLRNHTCDQSIPPSRTISNWATAYCPASPMSMESQTWTLWPSFGQSAPIWCWQKVLALASVQRNSYDRQLNAKWPEREKDKKILVGLAIKQY